jgi:zinc protease
VGSGPGEPIRHHLSNGTTLIVQEHRASEVVALQLWVKAGARDETAAELGLAHYLEHMVFKGTSARPQGFVDREVESVGGRINAATSLDYTYYHTVLPADRVAAGIEMLADIGVNATLDSALLEQEKKVVLEEMRLGEDNPRRFLAMRLYSNVFGNHPYGRPIIGRRDLITALTRETLANFYHRYYVPEAFTLVVVGAVNPDDVLAITRRTLGTIPRRGFTRLPTSAPTSVRPAREDVQRPGTHAYLGLGWLGPRLDHAETPALDLLISILGQARSSRLTVALRERSSIVNAIGASFVSMESGGMVTVTAQVDPANLARTEAEVIREIRRIRDTGVSSAELRRAITTAEALHEFSTETAEGRALALGRAATVWRLEEELGYVIRLRAVTTDEIRTAARRYLDPERYSRVILAPPPR